MTYRILISSTLVLLLITTIKGQVADTVFEIDSVFLNAQMEFMSSDSVPITYLLNRNAGPNQYEELKGIPERRLQRSAIVYHMLSNPVLVGYYKGKRKKLRWIKKENPWLSPNISELAVIVLNLKVIDNQIDSSTATAYSLKPGKYYFIEFNTVTGTYTLKNLVLSEGIDR